jgi:hypothetical protein
LIRTACHLARESEVIALRIESEKGEPETVLTARSTVAAIAIAL